MACARSNRFLVFLLVVGSNLIVQCAFMFWPGTRSLSVQVGVKKTRVESISAEKNNHSAEVMLEAATSNTKREARNASWIESSVNTSSLPTTKRVVQFGAFRSGSTFQFQVVCQSMFVKLLEQDDKRLGTKEFCCAGDLGLPTSFKTPNVLKTHNITQFPPSDKDDVWLFLSVANNTQVDELKRQGQEQGFQVKYVQDRQELESRGLSVLYDYQKIFNLTNAQRKDIAGYMRYWQIMRQCCGAQMSKDWRAQLLPNKKKDPDHVPYDLNSPSYPACHMYDMDQLESTFLNTRIVKSLMKYIQLHKVYKPSIVDDALNGTYCSRYNQAVRQYGLGFNKRIPRPMPHRKHKKSLDLLKIRLNSSSPL